MIEDNLRGKYIIVDGIPKTYNQIMSDYIRASEKIRCDITKEQDLFKMLDLSILCISTMTGDTVFYNQNKCKILEHEKKYMKIDNYVRK